MGISIPTSDAVGMGSEEGSSKTSPHDFGPTISDFVGDLKTWDNSKDWMLELRDGRKLVILLSVYHSSESALDQTASKGVVNLGLASLFNEGQIISWAPECDGVGSSVVSDFGTEGEAWDSDEGLLDWEHLGEPLEVAPLAMDNSVVTEITKVEEIGCKRDVDNTKLFLVMNSIFPSFSTQFSQQPNKVSSIENSQFT